MSCSSKERTHTHTLCVWSGRGRRVEADGRTNQGGGEIALSGGGTRTVEGQRWTAITMLLSLASGRSRHFPGAACPEL